ncbi:MAG: hypothetical protein AB7S78_02910 [Candidatus Omnitrophota bacterium]
MSQEYSCEGCRKAKLVDPTQDKFGEVLLLKFDMSIYNLKVDEALGNTRYEVLGKQREYICDKCVMDSRKGEFIGLGVFSGILLATTWIIPNEQMVQMILIIGFIGIIIYFVLRNPDDDIRDQILKKNLKLLGKTPVTRRESKML